MKCALASFVMSVALSQGCASQGFVDLPPSEVGRADYKLTGYVEDQSVEILDVLARLNGRPALIEIDSPGGGADEGLLIYKILRAAKSPTVCLVNGRASSAAFVILQGCTRRAMTSGSYLFTHEPSIYFSGDVSINPRALAEALLSLQKTSDQMAAIISSRMDMSAGAYKKRVVGDGWRMSPAEAIDANAIDVVVDGARSPL